MFFADQPAAFANLRRALRPDARAVLMVWNDLASNPWAALPARVASEVLGPTDPPALGAPGPFAWADPTVFGPILKEAGFSGLEWREAPVLLQVGETGEADPVTRAVAMLTRIGPAARRLKGQPEDVREALAERLAPALERYVEDGWVRMPGLVWVVRARA